ncbi:alpha-protein kinase 3 [Ctenodactylus gundi]
MGSKRVLGRSWGAGSRAGGDGEDDGPVWTPGPASRNYLLSVRPETSLPGSRLPHPGAGRSTFCSIIAQLTEETQPLFETTLKSRAVSEDSDVRFTCIVTGYPEPEVTWYKDDMELDRYCGLPKYEITHQGNRHTLQLYRCREEDAAIYQASARNSKGIVSCSGVLEVGTMTEYKIHQRWFAKLKRKAAAKMREIEQSWRQGREAGGEANGEADGAWRQLSPDRLQRKRRLSGARGTIPPVPPGEFHDEVALEDWHEGQAEAIQHPGLGLVPGFAPGEAPTNGEPATEDGEDGEQGLLSYLCEAMERRPLRASQKESQAKKKRKDEEARAKLPELGANNAARGHHSVENGVPNLEEAEGTPRPGDTEQVQTQLQDQIARVPRAAGRDGARMLTSAVVTQDKAPDGPVSVPIPAPVPAPGQELYFSLKDMYMESTLATRPQVQEEAPSSTAQAPGQNLPGKTPPRAGRSEIPKEPAPPLAPQPTRTFNRKRFAPPKPKAEPPADHQPLLALDSGAQNPSKALTQVPTPPARRKHSTRDSPLQGRAGHQPLGEVSESQATLAPTVPALSSPGGVSASHSSSRSPGTTEPMDTEPGRMCTARSTTDKSSLQVQAVGRTGADSPRTRADTATQESGRLRPERSSRKREVTQRQVETKVERTLAEERTQEDRRMMTEERAQEDRTTLAEERTEEDKRTPKEKGPQPENSVPAVTEGHVEPLSTTSHSPATSPPGPSPSEAPRSPQTTQTADVSCVPEKPCFTLQSEEPPGTAPRSCEHAVPGPRPGVLRSVAQPPVGSLEQGEGEAQARQEEQPGMVARSRGTPGGSRQEKSSQPSLPRPGLTDGTPAPEHPNLAAFPDPGDQALPLDPGSPVQSCLLGATASSSAGVCAQQPAMEGMSPAPRGCDPGLIDSLKNYLLLLLKLSSPDTGQQGPMASSALAPPVQVAGLSPRTSRRLLEQAEGDHLLQSAQSVLLSPATSRRLTGLLDQEVQAGRQALAATTPASQDTTPGVPAIPAIVVGGEDPETALEGPLKGPGLPSGLTAESRAGDPWQEAEDGLPGEAGPGLPAATPEELALGARRKRFLPKGRAAGDGEVAKPEGRDSPSVSPRGPRKGLVPGSPGTPGRERRSPTQGRKVAMLEVPRAEEDLAAGDPGGSPQASPEVEPTPGEGVRESPATLRKAQDLLKAPQVIRKIRVEQFPDASGSLKLWCQFFNILSDSVLTWAKDQHPVGEVDRSAGDEGPAALAIVQASPVDCGVYRCTIHNEHGSASTDFCLSPEVLSGFVSREEGEVGEEIEMTPMVFAKGLADSGCWGDKLFGRLASEELHGGGHGSGLRKTSRAKVIYGLEPIFESGRTCVIKVSSLLAFGPSSETSLLGRNYDVTIQGCKIQNMSREYCKIFAAEARAVPRFGEVPEIIPLYLIYRPASTIPYATLEEDLGKPPQAYCSREGACARAPAAASTSEVVQKCQAFQHWLYQWTNGSFLVTDLAGVDWKMTDVQIATKLRGYQGLKESCSPTLLDRFTAAHQCNTYCAMLALATLQGSETTLSPAKGKGPKSPSAGRKGAQLSPQPQKKGPPSPQGTRKGAPKATSEVPGRPPILEVGTKAQSAR